MVSRHSSQPQLPCAPAYHTAWAWLASKAINNQQLHTISLPSSITGTFPMSLKDFLVGFMHQLLSLAVHDGALGKSGQPNKIGTVFGQQLQESGFLQLLPELLSAAADRMQPYAASSGAQSALAHDAAGPQPAAAVAPAQRALPTPLQSSSTSPPPPAAAAAQTGTSTCPCLLHSIRLAC